MNNLVGKENGKLCSKLFLLHSFFISLGLKLLKTSDMKIIMIIGNLSLEFEFSSCYQQLLKAVNYIYMF